MFSKDAWNGIEFFFWLGLIAWAALPLMLIGGGIYWALS